MVSSSVRNGIPIIMMGGWGNETNVGVILAEVQALKAYFRDLPPGYAQDVLLTDGFPDENGNVRQLPPPNDPFHVSKGRAVQLPSRGECSADKEWTTSFEITGQFQAKTGHWFIGDPTETVKIRYMESNGGDIFKEVDIRGSIYKRHYYNVSNSAGDVVKSHYD